jgi:hypothetical protein
VLLRLMLSTSTLFFSLILGAIALALVGYNDPQLLSTTLGWARDLKSVITGTGLDPKYNIWVELLLEERQLLFMFFTIAARIVLGILSGLMLSIAGRN